MSADNQYIEAVADVARAWMAAPTDLPLVLERAEDGRVLISRGIQPARMTKTAAASFLSMSRPTLDKHLKRQCVRLGSDGKLSRKAVLSLFNALDGK